MNTRSAKKVVEFCHVAVCDSVGRAEIIVVPGHELKQYQVSIKRTKSSLTCYCAEREEGQCKGNEHGVCYHVVAALLKAGEGIGHLEFFENTRTPDILTEFGARKVEIISADGP